MPIDRQDIYDGLTRFLVRNSSSLETLVNLTHDFRDAEEIRAQINNLRSALGRENVAATLQLTVTPTTTYLYFMEKDLNAVNENSFDEVANAAENELDVEGPENLPPLDDDISMTMTIRVEVKDPDAALRSELEFSEPSIIEISLCFKANNPYVKKKVVNDDNNLIFIVCSSTRKLEDKGTVNTLINGHRAVVVMATFSPAELQRLECPGIKYSMDNKAIWR
ncbi:hypothetical protein DICVIV_11560 [Dictyocaulus viviparus]|uniref:Uncharacterized protein n=1 Tax=Dictyocaulus viviparus TaxID=29172 RepID=A0A0D8XFG8_DICVI|nr:hypothetical protein DICVIV_11560 [Dictyocaulus viviparus]